MKKFNQRQQEEQQRNNGGNVFSFNDVIAINEQQSFVSSKPKIMGFQHIAKKSVDLFINKPFGNEKNDQNVTLNIDDIEKQPPIRKNIYELRSLSQMQRRSRPSTQNRPRPSTQVTKSKSQSFIQTHSVGPYMNIATSIDQGKMINAHKYFGQAPSSPAKSVQQNKPKTSHHDFMQRIETIKNISQNPTMTGNSINIHNFLTKVNNLISNQSRSYMNKRRLKVGRSSVGISSEMQ